MVTAELDAELLAALNELNRDWPLGAVFHDERDACGAAVSMYGDDPELASLLLGHIAYLPTQLLSELRLAIPAAEGPTRGDLAAAFAGAGAELDAKGHVQTRAGGWDAVHVIGSDAEGRFMCVSAARHIRRDLDPGSRLRAINRANRRLVAGAVAAGPAGVVTYRLAAPLRWLRVDAALARWLLASVSGAAAIVDEELARL